MGLSEGAGGAIVKYGLIIGAIVIGGYIIYNAIKNFKWPDFTPDVNISIDPLGVGSGKVGVNEFTGLGGLNDFATDTMTNVLKNTLNNPEIMSGAQFGWDIASSWQGSYQEDKPYVPPVTGPGTNPPTGNLSAYDYVLSGGGQYPIVTESEVWKVPQDAAVLGGYLYQVGWVSEDSNQQAYPLWKDKYSNELMVGWDVNHVRSLENLLLSDILLGEEGRHNWSLI